MDTLELPRLPGLRKCANVDCLWPAKGDPVLILACGMEVSLDLCERCAIPAVHSRRMLRTGSDAAFARAMEELTASGFQPHRHLEVVR